MRKLSLISGVGALALTLLLLAGCGTDKNLSPYSILIYDGPYPTTVIVDVDPAYTRLQYFAFHIDLADPNLSILPEQDAWTIDSCTGTVTIDDPGGHILAPLPPISNTNAATVNSRSQLRYPIDLITKEWLETNAQGFVGTTDEATVTLNLVFQTHRNRDGNTQVFPVTWSYTIKDVTA